MKFNEVAALVISIVALFVSLLTFVMNYLQKRHQDRLASRKYLTDTVSSIVNTNLEMVKIHRSKSTPEMVGFRRNMNSQRRYLAYHADILTKNIPLMTTDVDHSVIAGAFDAAGDVQKATIHWSNAVAKSPSGLLKAFNLRGYARFMFSQGNPQSARKLYEQALEAAADDNDRGRRARSDTLVLWALSERELGFSEEADRCFEKAKREANRIGSESSRLSMLQYIDNVWQRNVAENTQAIISTSELNE